MIGKWLPPLKTFFLYCRLVRRYGFTNFSAAVFSSQSLQLTSLKQAISFRCFSIYLNVSQARFSNLYTNHANLLVILSLIAPAFSVELLSSRPSTSSFEGRHLSPFSTSLQHKNGTLLIRARATNREQLETSFSVYT